MEVFSFFLSLIIKVENSELEFSSFLIFIFILRPRVRVNMMLHITVTKQSYNHIL